MAKFVRIRGKIMWPRHLFVPDQFEGRSDYKANIVVDDENLKTFKDSGIRTKLQKDPDGNDMVLLKRPSEPKVFDDGSQVGGGAPRVIDNEGRAWPREIAIGNGSTVEALVSTYKGGSYTGHRLEEIIIVNHIPYVNEEARAVAEEPAAPKPKEEAKPAIPF